MIRKTALLAGAVLALSLASAPAALAQDDSCDAKKKAVVDLELKLKNASSDENVKERDAVKAAKAARDTAKAEVERLEDAIAAGNLDRAGAASLEEQLKVAKDTLAARKADLDKAQAKQDKDSDKVVSLRVQVEAAVAERDSACGVTTTPATPEPEADVDCDEVTDERAQEILSTDRSDPNNLDQDGDGIACEIDEVLDADDNADVSDNSDDEVAVPSGGVATGGGPA